MQADKGVILPKGIIDLLCQPDPEASLSVRKNLARHRTGAMRAASGVREHLDLDVG